MRSHIKLNHDEVHALLGCLLRAAEVGTSTGNLDLVGMAEDLTDSILDKWFAEGDHDV